ncbi:MAG: glycosyltransferase family 4 protein [Balneolaceae bacterium]|nr:glycosyltransferase family 4 protein [Balneolaceae bacterium]
MKILIVAQYYTPDITAAAFRMGETAELLRKAGHQVRVITTWPHKADVEVTSAEEGVARVRLVPEQVGEGGLLRYLAHYLSFVPGSVLKALKWRLGGWKPEVLWVSSPPLFTGLSGRIIQLLTGAPMVFDVRDIWPDTAVAAGQLSGDGRAYRWGRWLERRLYRAADRLTCVSRPMKAYLEEESGGKPVSVIYNGVAGDNSSATGTAPEAKEPRPSDSKTLVYAGNLGHLQGLDVLLEAFHRLRTQQSGGAAASWQIRLIGGGAEEEALRRLTRELGLEDQVHFEGVVSREKAARALREADLLFFSLKSHPVLEKTIPSKLFDYLQAGVPILGGVKGEGAQILQETGANLTFEAGDAADLAHTLREAFEKHTSLQARAPRNRELVSQRFGREAMTRKLISVFEKTREA